MIERRAVREVQLRVTFAAAVLIALVAVLGFIGVDTAQRWIEIRNEMAIKRCLQQQITLGRPVEDCRRGR